MGRCQERHNSLRLCVYVDFAGVDALIVEGGCTKDYIYIYTYIYIDILWSSGCGIRTHWTAHRCTASITAWPPHFQQDPAALCTWTQTALFVIDLERRAHTKDHTESPTLALMPSHHQAIEHHSRTMRYYLRIRTFPPIQSLLQAYQVDAVSCWWWHCVWLPHTLVGFRWWQSTTR